jgi:NAD dependent epimerase/dehydratase family enzyme
MSVLRTSRVDFTKEIIDAIEKLKIKPKVFLQGSAIGFYGMHNGATPIFSEKDKCGDDFLAKLCVDWESEALRAKEKGIRTQFYSFDESLGKRIRDGEKMKIPYLLVMGDKEAADKSVTVRNVKTKKQVTVPVSEFISTVTSDIKKRKLELSIG